MGFKFKRDRFLFLFFTFLGATLFVLLFCLLFLFYSQKKEEKIFQKARNSYLIAREMRQSSDDLTKMVRLYVLTGDKKYLNAYNEILAIRNGTSSRPIRYDEIYWDFVLDPEKRPRPYGKAVSLKQEMINEGFSDKETDLIEESQKRSDTLVRMETEAIYAMQGLYNNGSGNYSIPGAPNPELARRLVSNDEYMQQKALIMKPLLVFERTVEERLAGEIKSLEKRVNYAIVLSVFFTLLASVMMILCLLKSRKVLADAAQTNEDLLLNMLPASVAERFKRGEETIADKYQASVLFVHLDHFGDGFSVDAMSSVLDRLDDLTKKYGVEKIRVAGESHVVVAGIPVAVKGHEVILADFSLALRRLIAEFNTSGGFDLHLRMGMACGSVIAGVVGHKKFVYDLWGDVVTLASALEVSSLSGEIQVSETMAGRLRNLFDVEERGPIDLPGIGIVKSFFLKKRRIETKYFSIK